MKHMVWFEGIGDLEHACPEARESSAAVWHIRHGWFYHVWLYPDERIIGGFYVTLLAGYGGILHFEVYDPELKSHPGIILAAFRKALRIVLPCFDIAFVTIPTGNVGLVRIISRLGFRELCRFPSGENTICLMKYFPQPENYIKA